MRATETDAPRKRLLRITAGRFGKRSLAVGDAHELRGMISGINCQMQAMLTANLVAMIVQSTQSPTAADRRDRSGSMKHCGSILHETLGDRVPKPFNGSVGVLFMQATIAKFQQLLTKPTQPH